MEEDLSKVASLTEVGRILGVSLTSPKPALVFPFANHHLLFGIGSLAAPFPRDWISTSSLGHFVLPLLSLPYGRRRAFSQFSMGRPPR